MGFCSNLCRIFRLRGVHKMFGGSDFSRVERNFLIGQSPKIWGNFSKSCIKINKNLHNYCYNSRKCKFFGNFFNFQAGHKLLIMAKINNRIWTCYNGGGGSRGGGAQPPNILIRTVLNYYLLSQGPTLEFQEKN